jgi:hypothetical protein
MSSIALGSAGSMGKATSLPSRSQSKGRSTARMTPLGRQSVRGVILRHRVIFLPPACPNTRTNVTQTVGSSLTPIPVVVFPRLAPELDFHADIQDAYNNATRSSSNGGGGRCLPSVWTGTLPLRHRREDSARQTRPEVFSDARLEPLNALLYMMAFGKRRMIQLIYDLGPCGGWEASLTCWVHK